MPVLRRGSTGSIDSASLATRMSLPQRRLCSQPSQRASTFRSRMLELSGEFEQLEAENRALRVELHQSNEHQAAGKASDSFLRGGARASSKISQGGRTSIRETQMDEVSSEESFTATEIGNEKLDLKGVAGGEDLEPIRPSSAAPCASQRQRCARSSNVEGNEKTAVTTNGEAMPIPSDAESDLKMPFTLDATEQSQAHAVSSGGFEQPSRPSRINKTRRSHNGDEVTLQTRFHDADDSLSQPPRRSQRPSCSYPVIAMKSDMSIRSVAADVANSLRTMGVSSTTASRVRSASSWGQAATPQTHDQLGSLKVDSFLPGYLTDRDKLDVATDQALEDDDEPVGFCILAPASKFRVCWDLCMAVLLLYELWVTPFELIFVKEGNMPLEFAQISYGITAFFCVDILLNFNTGFFRKDRTIMNRREIVIHYMKRWLLIDIISTMPFDLIVASISGGLFRWVRFGKATKLLKTLRYLRLVRSVSLLASRREGNFIQIQKIMVKLRYLAEPLKVVVALMVFSHVHGCLWGALQPQWAPGQSLEDSFTQYYQSFRWAYIAITMGLIDPPLHEESAPYTWVLELIVSSERLCFCALVGIWAVFQSQTRLQDFARITKLKEEALDYLKRHQVSFNTQVQVLYILHETGNARNRQRHFRELMDNDLPLELHRKICSELWCTRLMSLGLITHVAALQDNFLMELAMLVREEVFASKAVIFRYGDAAIASYCVIDGTLVAVHVPGTEKVPEFIVGHWIGETALVSPALRRDMTIVTKKITSLMGVPAEAFFELLESHHLMDAFEQVCKEYLWRGLCGRCGSLGDHFVETCPMLGLAKPYTIKQNSMVFNGMSGLIEESAASYTSMDSINPNEKKNKKLFGSSSTGGRKSTQCTIHRDLSQFLQVSKQNDLVPILGMLGVNTLKDLQALNIDVLQDALPQDQKLTEEQQAALSTAAIQKFQESAARSVQRQLFGLHVDNEEHYIFLSHAKVEAGTEAALMKEELEKLLREDNATVAKSFTSPIFLDSDNLTTLSELQATVLKSHNIVVLLTSGVLTRPWVLVEIVTAVQAGVRVLPVQVSKPGTMFEFPSEDWYVRLFNGELLTFDGIKVLHEAGINLKEVEAALREMFRQIAVPYSPHRPAEMRKAELKLLMKRCRLKCPVETGSTRNGSSADSRVPTARKR